MVIAKCDRCGDDCSRDCVPISPFNAVNRHEDGKPTYTITQKFEDNIATINLCRNCEDAFTSWLNDLNIK